MVYRQKKETNLFEKEFTLELLAEMGNAGRKAINPVQMMKVLFLQCLYGLGDRQAEFQIKDRMSFREFLDIDSVDDVPDEKTIWKYRDEMIKDGTWDRLFEGFNKYLESIGLMVNEGKIVDASFVIAPRQRNTREENNAIKAGEGEGLWEERPHKKSHKDVDARWTKKRGETYFGYKDHAIICRKTKLIRGYEVTAANVHDSPMAKKRTEGRGAKGEKVWLDAGYVGTEDDLKENGFDPIVCEKGYRGHPMTDAQKESNRVKSRVRSRVEHVFGFMEQTMYGLVFRGVGMARAKANVAMTNLEYNLCRLVQIHKYHKNWIAVIG